MDLMCVSNSIINNFRKITQNIINVYKILIANILLIIINFRLVYFVFLNRSSFFMHLILTQKFKNNKDK